MALPQLPEKDDDEDAGDENECGMSEMIMSIMLAMTTQMMWATMIETHSTDIWGRSRIEKNYVFGISMQITKYCFHSIIDLFCWLQIG